MVYLPPGDSLGLCFKHELAEIWGPLLWFTHLVSTCRTMSHITSLSLLSNFCDFLAFGLDLAYLVTSCFQVLLAFPAHVVLLWFVAEPHESHAFLDSQLLAQFLTMSSDWIARGLELDVRGTLLHALLDSSCWTAMDHVTLLFEC